MLQTLTTTISKERIKFEVYTPDHSDPDILFVHHGASRNTYSSGSGKIAEREGLTVFSPIFPESSYDSDEYQRAGIVDDRRNVVPENQWTTRLEDPMIEWARDRVGGDADVYLFGHSGGGQYLNRVAAYDPPEGIARIVIANPSTWVLPSLSEDAPYGFDGLGTAAEERAALKDYLALPMTIFLGGEDDNPNDTDLSTGSAAMRQGSTRLERGINTFEMGEDVAEANGWDFNWSLVIAEGVGHSGSSMLRSPEMSEALQPFDLNGKPYDIVLSGLSVDEMARGGTVVGELSARDPDGDKLTFSVSGDPRFVVKNTDQLVVAQGADLTGTGNRRVDLTVSASDGHGGIAKTVVNLTIKDTPNAAPDPIGESGTITFTQAHGSQWHKVTFEKTLDDPSVVMGGLTSNGSDASTLRVRQVTDSGFEFQLDEWDYLDGRHMSETVSWIAIEKGTHNLSNGTVIQAGSANASGSASDIDFAKGNFSATPTVLAQVTSTKDAGAVTDRVHDVNASGFAVRLDSEESESRGSHGRESIDWIALETGGSANSDFVVGRTGNVVTSESSLIDFKGAFSSDHYAFVADIQTSDGRDTADLRLSTLNDTRAGVYVHEEQSRDSETWHTSEVVGYMGMETGLIYTDLLLI